MTVKKKPISIWNTHIQLNCVSTNGHINTQLNKRFIKEPIATVNTGISVITTNTLNSCLSDVFILISF